MTVDSSNSNLFLQLGFGISQIKINQLSFTRVDEEIVFFEHRLSDGKQLLKGLQTLVVEVLEIDVVCVLGLKRHVSQGYGRVR